MPTDEGKEKKEKRKKLIEIRKNIILLPTEVKLDLIVSGKYIGFMCSSRVSLLHLIADLLLSYIEEGCRVDYGLN